MQTIRWQKSTYSGDSSNCVEIATAPTTILIRDSKDAAGPRLDLSRAAWTTFLAYADKIGKSEFGA
ncbi:DUF397 domain-containing protein [Streptomyces sp. NWU339]|uniref:DUF397 domain-containing protein n=1 Tax=Streptomyces sp. NWU339 TaxID=2185284 RepID=UPI000D6805F3|nr:DUF397 domain-containing protein [Streptomyces sp. NWU339]PWI10295.1 DUF397 domain-containing protein [Streptomyces sp. NWU339]